MELSKALREYGMKRFVEQEERSQIILLPERLDDYVNEDNPVRVVDVFVEGLHLAALGFEGVTPAKAGRPAYHPAVLLKLYRTRDDFPSVLEFELRQLRIKAKMHAK
jgi:transposase